jgi:hypothetical protein
LVHLQLAAHKLLLVESSGSPVEETHGGGLSMIFRVECRRQ